MCNSFLKVSTSRLKELFVFQPSRRRHWCLSWTDGHSDAQMISVTHPGEVRISADTIISRIDTSYVKFFCEAWALNLIIRVFQRKMTFCINVKCELKCGHNLKSKDLNEMNLKNLKIIKIHHCWIILLTLLCRLFLLR